MKTIVSAIFVLLLAAAANAAVDYHVIKRLRLGGEGGWDYLTVDSAAHQLYISRGAHVTVIDTMTDKVIGNITGTRGVHGIALAPELRCGFTSNGKANTASIFDKDSLQAIRQVKTGEEPDAILYEPYSLHVFAFNGKSNDTTIFSAATGSVLATVALGGKPASAAADKKGRVFVNIEDTNQVVELDGRTLTITKRHSLKPCEGPTGMAIDIAHHRIFSGCRNKMMAVTDVDSGNLLATVPISEGVHDVAFDPGTGLAFSTNGDGTLTVVRETSPGKFETETAAIERGTKAMALDPKTHKIYLATSKFEAVPLSQAGSRKQRPTMIKRGLAVLVLGR